MERKNKEEKRNVFKSMKPLVAGLGLVTILNTASINPVNASQKEITKQETKIVQIVRSDASHQNMIKETKEKDYQITHESKTTNEKTDEAKRTDDKKDIKKLFSDMLPLAGVMGVIAATTITTWELLTSKEILSQLTTRGMVSHLTKVATIAGGCTAVAVEIWGIIAGGIWTKAIGAFAGFIAGLSEIIGGFIALRKNKG